MIDDSKCKTLGHYANECRNEKDSRGDDKHVSFPVMCYENREEEKNANGGEEHKQESKIRNDYERNVDPGTARNTENTQGTQLMKSYVRNIFSTGIMSEWVMSTIKYNLATPRVLSSV